MKRAGKRVEASWTAQLVAAARTVGGLLPPELVIARDPFGVEFAHGGTRKLADLLLRRPFVARLVLPRAGFVTAFLLWMQLRTRALDEMLLDFAREGRQLVLLGAGYDCRALRFAAELAGVSLFEVDHPATQAEKIRLLPVETFHTRVVYVPFDFERDPLETLAAKLHAHGLDPRAPVLTIWEGVTVYLDEPAVDATVRAVRAFADDSRLAFTYYDQRALRRPGREVKLSARLVKLKGEPWRFGWDPRALPDWLRVRDFALVSDETDAALAARLLPAHARRHFQRQDRHLALARSR